MLECLDFLQSLDCFRRYKERSFDLLRGAARGGVVDVACGQGDDVVGLKQQFDSAIGVDASDELIAEARRRHADTGCEFRVADAANLPFGSGELAAARIDRSLQHIEDPPRVLYEMARVVQQGGRIVCAEPDWGTFFVSAPNVKNHKSDSRTLLRRLQKSLDRQRPSEIHEGTRRTSRSGDLCTHNNAF